MNPPSLMNQWLRENFFCNVNIPLNPRKHSNSFRLPIAYEEDNRYKDGRQIPIH